MAGVVDDQQIHLAAQLPEAARQPFRLLERRGRVSIAMDEKNGRADRVRLVERRSAAEHLLKLGTVASSRLSSKVRFDGVKLQAVPGARLGPREPVLEVGDRIVCNQGADVVRLRGD